MKEFLEYHIFEELEPEHDGRDLYVFKKHTGRKFEKNCIDKAIKKIEKKYGKRLHKHQGIKSNRNRG